MMTSELRGSDDPSELTFTDADIHRCSASAVHSCMNATRLRLRRMRDWRKNPLRPFE